MIFGRFSEWRKRLYAMEQTVLRMEQVILRMEGEIGELRSLIEASRRVQDDARNEANQGIAAVHGTVVSTERIAGETLAAANDHNLHAMALADRTRQAIGRLEARQLRYAGERSWHENEFRVYSQHGEDGLLQFLFREMPDAPRSFVEFGVEDYQESNTRFLLLHDRSWSGLAMDGSEENVAAIRENVAYQRYDLKAIAAWITRENISALISDNGFSGEIGLLSVDVDGNDYWIWEATTGVDPVVVVVEYNYRFGPDASVVVPYDPTFDKMTAHSSGIYYGSSLRALATLANRKGYAFVGCSRGGVNAFFVRRDRLPDTIREVSVGEGFVPGYHAEMVDPESGERVKAPLEVQRDLLLGLPLVSIEEITDAPGLEAASKGQ